MSSWRKRSALAQSLRSVARDRFIVFFGLDSPLLYGPFTGRLSNGGERVSLEAPDAPDQPGDPIIWVPLDEVVYFDQAPWPGADGTGESLQRASIQQAANDPSNWTAGTPTPGTHAAPAGDGDDDGMPDVWEQTHGLDPNNPADALADSDGDGLSNLDEFLAGTHPNDPASLLSLTVSTQGNTPVLSFNATEGRSYSLLVTEDLVNGPWIELERFTEGPGLISIPEISGPPFRYFRIVTPASP